MVTIIVYGIPIFVTLWGIRIIFSGRYKTGHERILVGTRARIVGVIFCLSIPSVFVSLVFLQIVLIFDGALN